LFSICNCSMRHSLLVFALIYFQSMFGHSKSFAYP